MENDANWSLIFMVNIITRSNDDSRQTSLIRSPNEGLTVFTSDLCLPPCCLFIKLCYDDPSEVMLPGTPDLSSFQKDNVHAKASFQISRTNSN